MAEDFDVIDSVMGQYKTAGQALVGEGSADDAARAFQVSSATGLSPETAAANPDEIEKAHKQYLGQQILNQNPALTGFVNAHPLHGQLINDDVGNLDTFTKAMERLNGKHAAEAGFRGFKEGFGAGFGQPTTQFIEEKMPQAGHLARAAALTLGVPFETMARAFSGGVGFVKQFTNQYAKDMGLSEQASEKFSNDLAGLVEYELMKPEAPRVPHEASPAPPASGEVSPPAEGSPPGDFGRRLVQELGPYLEAGQRPPPGANPLTDLLYEHQAEQNKALLKETFDAGEKSVLKQRSPDKFSELMDHVVPQTARIPTEVLAKNPDVAEALGVSPERLQDPGSVGVQVKDLLRLEKDQHKAIEDDVAIGDDLSTNEVKELKEATPQPVQPVDPVLDTIRQASSLEPPERVVGAAIRYQGEVHEGATHPTIVDDLERRLGSEVGYIPEEDQGFVTSKGRYVNRQEAAKIAEDAGQYTRPKEYRNADLDSKDLIGQPSFEEPLIRREDEPPRPLGAGVPLARSAIGRTGREMTKYEQLIAQRDAEDVEWRLKRAEAQAHRENTTDWKAEAERIRLEVEDEVRSRPDIAAFKFFDDGQYMGQKLGRRPKLARDRLTDEQIDQLPDRFVSDRGMDPDDVANLWGFADGEDLIRTLAATEREAAGFRGDIVKRLTDAEVFRRVNEKLGESAEERLAEAKDHALSITQMEMLHEQMVQLASRVGAEVPLTKQAVDFGAAKLLDEEVFGAMKSDRYLREAGKAGRRLEKALLADDPLVAFQNAQAQYISAQIAKDARKIERQAKLFDRQANRFRDREVSGFNTEETAPYKRWVQDILMRLGRTVARTEGDLAAEIQASADTSLGAFIDSKKTEGREFSIPEFLLDPSFKKPIEELSVREARQAMGAVNSLIKNGRDEGKIISAGQSLDKAEALDKAKAQIIKSREITGPAEDLNYQKGPWTELKKFGRSYLAVTLSVDNILNRMDHFDPFGFFNQYVGRPLFEAGNYAAKLDRDTAKAYGQLPGQLSPEDLNASVPNNLFRRPDPEFNFEGQPFVAMTKRNFRAVLLNVGNASNRQKLADGFKLEPAQVMQWVHQIATKADWDWAQAHGDLFGGLWKQAQNMYRRLSGEAPESLELTPIQTPFGTYPGWYHPLIEDKLYVKPTERRPQDEDLFTKGYTRASTPAGYSKSRTGVEYPLSLELDEVPGRFYHEIHDIAFREAVINASKIIYEPKFRNQMRASYGKEFEGLFIPWLQDIANSANVTTVNQEAFARWAEFTRQNTIGMLVGFNPRTIEKHTLTAGLRSAEEVGFGYFKDAFHSVWTTDPASAKKQWNWAMDTFEELQRRHQNWMETISGAQQSALIGQDWRRQLLSLQTKPIAYLDLASAVPTAIAAFTKATEEGRSPADAIYAGNRAVARAHGSTAITYRPEIMRRGFAGIGGPWIASLYSFMNRIANRQYELAVKAKETAGLASKGETAEALKNVPELALGLTVSVLAVAVFEELVTPSSGEKESFEKQVAKGGLKSLAAPWPLVRDVANAIAAGKDPSFGLANTEAKPLTDLIRDAASGRYGLNKQHAGKTVKHAITAIGIGTGLAGEFGNVAEFLTDLHSGKARPRSLKDWYRGLTKGEMSPRDNRPDLVERGLRVIEGGR